MADTPQYGDGSLPVSVDPTCWFGRTNTPPAQIDIGTILTGLYKQLGYFFSQSSFLSTIAIYEWPNTDLDTWWNSGSPAFVLIAYVGTHLSKPIDSSTMLQDRDLEFSFFIVARQTAWGNFTGEGSPFILLDFIEAALTGYRPTGCRNSYFSEERFSEQDPEGRIWLYRMRLNVSTMRVKLAASYVLAKAKQISALVGALGSTSVNTYYITNGGLTLPVNTIVISVVNSFTEYKYVAGTDYLVNSVAGTLVTVPGGSLTNGTLVVVTTIPTETVTATGS